MTSTRIRVSGGSANVVFENKPEKLKELETIFKSMDTKKGKLSSNSIKSYVSKLNRLSILCLNHSFYNDKFLMTPKKVINKIDNSNLKSKKDYIGAICKYLSHKKIDESILKQYHDAMNVYKNETNKSRDKNQATPINVYKSLSMEDIKNKISKFKINDEFDLFDLVIVLFYFGNTDNFIPRNDLPNFKITYEPYTRKPAMNKLFNYLTIDRKNKPLKLIMNNYKTAPTYGKKEFNISNELKHVLTIYLNQLKKQPGDYLFVMRDGMTPYTKSGFAYAIERAMKNVLGTPINVDLARQIITTNWYKNNPLASKEEKDEFASRFLHSASTNFEYMRSNLNH